MAAETVNKTFQNRYEAMAHNQRRQYIQQGYEVSLIAYNPESDSYDFDVYGLES